MEKSESKTSLKAAASLAGRWTWISDVPLLKPEQIIYYSIRSVDDFETEMLKHYKVETYFADDIIKSKKVIYYLLQHLLENYRKYSYFF